MSKEIQTICIEGNILKDFKRIVGKGNISKKIEKFMEGSINQDPELLDQAILNKKMEKLNNEITPLIAERDKIERALNLLKKEAEKEELKQLEEKKEEENKLKSCFNCGKVITENDKLIIREENNFCNAFCFEKFKQEERFKEKE